MDRVNGTDWVDIGGGRRGFRSQNAAAGVPGTEITDKILNDLQEEICAVIEKSGLVLDPENQQQLWEALQLISAPGFANRSPWLPVLSMTTTAPPNGAVLGDTYLIPAGATGAWAGKAQSIAEWSGSAWRIFTPKDGHGIGLPDGRAFIRIDGVYVELLASTWEWVKSRKTPIERLNSLPWLPVKSITLAAPPAGPDEGDLYAVAAGATGAWAGKSGQIAEWSTGAWVFSVPYDGHGVSLPDGRVFERVGGVYVEKLALDAQSGKWVAATDTGVVNALVVDISPVPSALPAFLMVSPKVVNTGPATIKVNGLAAVSIKRRNDAVLLAGDLQPGTPAFLLLSNGAYILTNPLLPPPPGTGLSGRQSFTGWKPVSAASHDLTATFTAPATGMVIAISTLNKSYNATDPNILNSIAITGVGAEGDWVNTSTSSINAVAVQKGQLVTVTSNIQVEVGIAVPMSQYLTYIFIPA